MSNNIVKLPRPKTFTAAEQMLEAVREELFLSGLTYKALSLKVNVSESTIKNLMTGKTRWPRPTTLFPLLEALGIYMSLGRIRVRNP